MSLFKETVGTTFTLKEVIGYVTLAITFGAAIARFEYKSDSMNNKLDTVIAAISENKKESKEKFLEYDKQLTELRAVTTSLTATMVKPDDIRIKRYR